jgi:hypothetical protein
MKQKLEEILSAQPHSVADMLNGIKNRKIFLYGAGNVGGQMLDVLRQYGIEPFAFLDKNASSGQTKDGVVALAPDDKSLSRELRGEAVVFISILLDREPRLALCEQLKALGYTNLRYAFAWVMRNRGSWKEASRKDSWKTSAREAFDFLEDEESRDIYIKNLSALLFDDDGDGFAVSSKETQYFDNTIPFRKTNMRFVDCGAFTGDTLESLCDTAGRIDAYAGFEPMPSNLAKFVDTAERLRDKIGAGVIFPCAVGAKNEVLTFTDASSSSRIQADVNGGGGGGVNIPVFRVYNTHTAYRPPKNKRVI